MHTASGAIDGGGVIVLMLDVVWGGIVVLAAVPTLANALTGHLEAAAVRLLGFNFWAAVTPFAAWTSAALAPVWVFVPIASLARPEKAREALLEPNSVAIVVAVFFLDHLPFFSLPRPLAALVHLHLLAAPTGTVRSPELGVIALLRAIAHAGLPFVLGIFYCYPPAAIVARAARARGRIALVELPLLDPVQCRQRPPTIPPRKSSARHADPPRRVGVATIQATALALARVAALQPT